MTRKVNVWNDLETIFRKEFPYSYPETNWRGQPIKEDELEDYYEPSNDSLIDFLSDREGVERVSPSGDITLIEFNSSFYETVDYDDIPQGTEDECDAIVQVNDKFYKVSMFYRSSGGYTLYKEAYEVTPKQIEVTIYE